MKAIDLQYVKDTLLELDPTLKNCEASDTYNTAIVLLAALTYGPDAMRLAEFTRLPFPRPKKLTDTNRGRPMYWKVRKIMREAFVPVDHEGSILWTAGSQIKAPNTGCSVRPTRTGAAPSAASIKSGRFASQDFRDRSIGIDPLFDSWGQPMHWGRRLALIIS